MSNFNTEKNYLQEIIERFTINFLTNKYSLSSSSTFKLLYLFPFIFVGIFLSSCDSAVEPTPTNPTTEAYRVTFDLNANDATGTFNPLTVERDNKVIRPTEIPTRTGYTFTNWVTSTAINAPNFNFTNTKITEDTVIYAKWTIKSYQVSFNLNASDATSTINPLTTSHGSKLTRPTEIPTRTGYTFTNWVTSTAINAPNFNFTDTKITEDTVIYAKWTIKSYQVSFNLNASDATSTINPLTTSHGSKLTHPTEIPTRTGYTFANWVTSTAINAPNFNFTDTKITEDTIIYAKWTIKSYQVSFNLNATDATGTIEPLTVAHDAKVIRPTIIPTRVTHTFANWVTSTATDAPNFNFADTKITENTIIYAKWSTKSYQVSFNLNATDATGTIEPLTVAHDAKVIRPTIIPTRTTHTFANWVTSTATDAPNFNFADTKITEDTIIYAKWTTKSYQVTFNLNATDATGIIEPLTVAHDAKVIRPTIIPTRTTHTFANWVTSTATDAPNFNFTDTKITEDTVIYAKWTAKSYQVTFNMNAIDATGTIEPLTVVHDGKVTHPTIIPTRTTHTFTNWVTSTAADAPNFNFTDTKITEDTIIYAKWTAKSYQVTFNMNAIDATGTIEPLTVVHDGKVTRPTIIPTRTTHTFTNWVTSTAADAPNFNFTDTKITEDTVIYAKWTLKNGLIALSLEIGGTDYIGRIVGTTVNFSVPNTSVSSGIIKVITVSNATADTSVNDSINFIGGTATNAITVTAEDNTQAQYTLQLLSNVAKLTSITISLDGTNYSTSFSDGVTNATFFVLNSTITTATLTLATLSSGASSSPAQGEILSFTNKVSTIEVTAEDELSKETYKITLTNANSLSSVGLTINGAIAEHYIEDTNIFVAVENKATVNTALITNISIANGASSVPAKGEELTFTESNGAKTSAITIKSGILSKVYTVILQNNTNLISSFVFTLASNVAYGITEDKVGVLIQDKAIAIGNLPIGVNLTNLIPTIVHNGQNVSPASDTGADFSSQVTYTVTSEYGTERNYFVSVSKLLVTTHTVTFNLGTGVTGTVDSQEVAHDGYAVAPELTDIPVRTTHTFDKWVTTANGDTEFVFSSTKIIAPTTIYAKWNAKSATKELTALTLEIGSTNYIGRIDGSTVKFSVPNKTITSATVKVITTPNATANKSINDNISFTGGIATNAITVTAEDSTTVQYTLQLLSNIAKLTTISLSIGSTEYTTTFSDTMTSKTLQVSDETVTTATITLVTPPQGATVNPTQGTTLSFTNKVATVEVTAEDGIAKETYTITLQKAVEELTAFPKKLTKNEPANVNPSSITKETATLYVTVAGVSTLKTSYNNKEWIKHDVTATKIEYNSDVLGTAKTLSGLVMLPHDSGSNAYDKSKPLPILLVCHGTKFVRTSVPSNFKFDGTTGIPTTANLSGFELGATAGAMVVIPDYAGLGVDTNTFHPYFIKEPSGKNTIDAVYAAAELANNKGYKVSKDLYIVGYSEGGYVSLSSTEYAEKNAASHFNIVESYCGAGAYLPHEMWETVLEQTAYRAPAFVVYVGKSYTTYNIISSLDDLLIPTLITKTDELLDGTKPFLTVNTELFNTLGTGKTFRDMFVPAVLADVKGHVLYSKLRENSFVDGSFKTNVIFYHSRGDTIIPFVNTESTITKIRENNATKSTGGTVTLEELTGDHVPAYNLMLGKVIEKLVGHIQE